MIQQPADPSVETNHPARGGRGRTGVPAPESGEQTLSRSPAPNHVAGINTVKRVSSTSGRALHRLAGGPPPTPARPDGDGKGVGSFIRPVAAPVRLLRRCLSAEVVRCGCKRASWAHSASPPCICSASLHHSTTPVIPPFRHSVIQSLRAIQHSTLQHNGCRAVRLAGWQAGRLATG